MSPVPNGPNTIGGSAGRLNVRSEIDNQEFEVQTNNITSGYFRTLGNALIDGRDFTPNDSTGSRPVGIINETLARRL